MPLFRCPSCRAEFQLEENWAGQRAKCTDCGTVSVVQFEAFDFGKSSRESQSGKAVYLTLKQAGFQNCVAASTSLTGLTKVAIGLVLAAAILNVLILIFVLASAVRTDDYDAFKSLLYLSWIAWFAATPVLAFGYFCVRILAACGELILASAQRFAREKIRGDGIAKE